MFILTDADKIDDTNYNQVRCPKCNARLCDKPIGTRASALKIKGRKFDQLSCLLLRCNICKSKYLVSLYVEQ